MATRRKLGRTSLERADGRCGLQLAEGLPPPRASVQTGVAGQFLADASPRLPSLSPTTTTTQSPLSIALVVKTRPRLHLDRLSSQAVLLRTQIESSSPVNLFTICPTSRLLANGMPGISLSPFFVLQVRSDVMMVASVVLMNARFVVVLQVSRPRAPRYQLLRKVHARWCPRLRFHPRRYHPSGCDQV